MSKNPKPQRPQGPETDSTKHGNKKGHRRGNGDGSIYQRKDGRWVGEIKVGYGPGGKVLKRYAYGRTEAEVRAALKPLLSAQWNGTLPTSGPLTVDEFLDQWLDHKRDRVREVTLEGYRDVLRLHVRPVIGKIKLEKLGAADLDRLYQTMIAKGLAPRTPRLAHRLLHGALKQAVRWGLVPRNVTEMADPPPAAEAKSSAWTPEEARRFIRVAAKHPLYPLFQVALVDGLRRGELLGLRWSDVDLKLGRVQVRQALVFVRGKGQFSKPKTRKGERGLALPPVTVAALERHRAAQVAAFGRAGLAWSEEGLVFTKADGTPLDPSTLRREFLDLTTRAGVRPIRLHDLRHTNGSFQNQLGQSLKVISAVLGHASASFTANTYVHTYDPQLDAAVKAVEDLLEEDEHGADDDEEDSAA